MFFDGDKKDANLSVGDKVVSKFVKIDAICVEPLIESIENKDELTTAIQSTIWASQ